MFFLYGKKTKKKLKKTKYVKEKKNIYICISGFRYFDNIQTDSKY